MSSDLPIVGREAELGSLADLVVDATAGRGRVALLLGEAGIGKTSLAEAADGFARTAGLAVVWGRCPARGDYASTPIGVLHRLGRGR